MKIRSVTCFARASQILDAEGVLRMGELGEAARRQLQQSGYALQTVRLATQPLNEFIKQPKELVPFAVELERLCSASGIHFKGLGAIQGAAKSADLSLIGSLYDVIRQTENVFAAVQIAARGQGINLRAIHATARLIRQLEDAFPQGIGNFRFAALANVRAGAPFFPAAFADGNTPSFSLATEAADLAVEAVSAARTLDDARQRLSSAIEREANTIARIAHGLAQRTGVKFNGIDFTLAPDVPVESSFANALERLTGNAFGERTTLFGIAFMTDCIRRAQIPRAGFSGAFFPVLEDSIVSARSHDKTFSLDSLLLFSTVCGTGLDNIPLPGDVSADALGAILLDLAALAVKLDKPLTARLLPIPNARVGDTTNFDFRWFSNARVMDTHGVMTQAWADKNEWIEFK